MKQCSFDGCDKKVLSRGLCAAHYQQQRQGQKLKPLQRQLHGLSEYDRFMAWVDVAGPNECWLWKGSRQMKKWYGQFHGKNGNELAHRAAWRLLKGEIPAGMFILHRCDNPICTNPAHLFMGNQSDNARDMWAKRRGNPGTSIGEDHGMAKLTAADVQMIRRSEENGPTLASKLGVSVTTISEIRRRKTWKHV